MIGNVQSKTKIQASKINNIIDNVNANSRNLQSLMHPTMTPFPDARKLAPEMYFHVMRTAITEDTGDSYSTATGALLYVGGDITHARYMCMIDNKRIDNVIICRNGEFQTLDELKASLPVPNQYGGYIPIFDYGKDGNTTIMAALFYKEPPPNVSTYSQTGYILAIFCTTDAFITEESVPVKVYKDEYYLLENTIRVIYSENEFRHTVLKGLSNSASDAGSTFTRRRQNQCHLGVLQYSFLAPMFLDARYNKEKNCWEVYVGNDIKCVAFNNCAIEHISGTGWVRFYLEPTEPIWGMITGESIKSRELILGSEYSLFDVIPSPPTGDSYIPQLGPFPIAEFKNDKVIQIFHGAPVNNFILPDASMAIDDMYSCTGTDFERFKSLEISPMKNLDKNISGNYMNLYNFHSKKQNNNACVGDQGNWFNVGIYDSKKEPIELSGYSTGKTMLIRDEGSVAKLEYNIPTIDIQSVQSAMSGYLEDIIVTKIETEMSSFDSWTCEYVVRCGGEIVEKIVRPELSSLSGEFWHQGGAAGTNYGSTIGNSNKETVIDLDNKVLKAASSGQWSVENGLKITNNDLIMPEDGVVFFPSNNGWPKIVIGGILFGPKTIVDGNGEAQLVLGQITT
jgi:hypothetical protein